MITSRSSRQSSGLPAGSTEELKPRDDETKTDFLSPTAKANSPLRSMVGLRAADPTYSRISK